MLLGIVRVLKLSWNLKYSLENYDVFSSFFIFVNTRIQKVLLVHSFTGKPRRPPSRDKIPVHSKEQWNFLSQHEYFLEPFLCSEINKFPTKVYSTAIQRTLTHIAASFQYCASNSYKHCVLTSHWGKSKYYYNIECKPIGSMYLHWWCFPW